MTPLERLLAAYAGPASVPSVPSAPAYGTQTQPLDSFSVDGRTGNKTTNKDLPEWLRKLGMKGDAYAGGMLKPQIRYGFWYKNGKINFADGTSFAAKKNKDGSYSYTDASGAQQVYSPTDEQNAYNKKYKASTSNQSFLDKVENTAGFEIWKGKDILKNFGVNNLFFGIDPAGVKIGNTITGRNDKPLVDAFGGATDEDFARYGKPTGFAEPIHDVAHVVAAYYGGQGLNNLGSKFIGTAGSAGSSGSTTIPGINGNVSIPSGSGGMFDTSGSIFGTGGGMAGTTGFNWTDWIGPALSAGAAIYGGKKGADAVKAGELASLAENARQFDLVRSDTAPVRALGSAAVGRLAQLYGHGQGPDGANGPADMSAFFASPDFEFNLGEGQKAIDRSAAARGGLLSGAAVKEGQRFASGLASREYSGFVDRLMQQAGLGNTGIGASAAAGANSASNVSNVSMNAGNNRASIYGNTAANVNNSIQTGLENQMLRRYLGG